MTLAVLTLLFAQYGDYRSFAPVLGVGVFVTLIAGLTLMPALLALLGRRAFWPRVPKEGDETEHRRGGASPRGWPRVRAVPRWASLAILVVLALGCLFYSPRFSFTEDFLKNMPSKQGYALLEQHFPKGALAPTTVLIKAPQAPPEFVAGMITGALNKSPGVAAAFPTGTADDGKLLSFQVILKGDPYSSQALEQVRQLRTTARKAAGAGGGTALVGGPTAIQADTWAQSNRDTIVVAVAALVVVGVILMLLLRAIVAPIYLLLTNVLSYLAALGATIVITEKLLGWEHISYRIPLYMFIFLVALGSDYNIFITTRIRGEAMARGLRDGTVKALSATGGVLTSAGIILAGTFLILLSQPVKDLAEISIGVALGVLIDTFLVRTALVPGLTLWIGPKAGWPGPLWTKKGAEAEELGGRAGAVRGGRRAAGRRGLADRRRRAPSGALAARSRTSLLAAQRREEDDVADAGRAGEDHHQAVDAHAEAAGGRHAVLHRLEEVLVEPVRGLVAVGEVLQLLHEALALVVGVVELAEGVAQLHAGDEPLEALDEARVVRRLLGERARLERVLGDEHRLDELGLDALAEQLVDLGAPGGSERDDVLEALLLDARLQIGDGARVVGADVDAGLVLDRPRAW